MDKKDEILIKKALILCISELIWNYEDVFDEINREMKEKVTGDDLFIADDVEASTDILDAFMKHLEAKWGLDESDIIDEASALVPEEESKSVVED